MKSARMKGLEGVEPDAGGEPPARGGHQPPGGEATRVAAATVTGLGGDTEKGPSSKGIQAEKGTGQTCREFKGEEVRSVVACTVLFYNPDGHWTLADSQRPDPQAPWDPNRARRVRRIDVVLNRP